MLGLLLVLALTAGIVGFVFGFVFLIDREWDGHPLLRKILNGMALTVPGYVPPDLPKSYTDQVPGWDATP